MYDDMRSLDELERKAHGELKLAEQLLQQLRERLACIERNRSHRRRLNVLAMEQDVIQRKEGQDRDVGPNIDHVAI